MLRNPDDPSALVDRFRLVPKSGANLALMRRAYEAEPGRFEVMFNLASALMWAGHYSASLDMFMRALDKAPHSHRAQALCHVGMAWHDFGDFNEAVDWYDRAIEADPDDVEIRQSRAIAHLASGALGEGLFDFEVRWHKPARKPIAQSGIPRWQGEDLTDKTIIVAHEQGWGDTIQFCRVIPMLKAKQIILSGPPVLTGLIADNIEVDVVMDEDGPFNGDFYCSPMSAAGALGLQYSDIDGAAYLHAKPMKLPKRGGLNVGLAWKGNPDYAQDANRSMRLEDLAPLFEIPGLSFYSLQMEDNDVSALGLDGFIADASRLIKDWRDTASVIAALDVVVTVDTAVAHLAGALGKPTMILLPYSCCWRWMRDTETTPWYHSARLYRQHTPGEWEYSVQNVARALRNINGRQVAA